MNMNVSNHEAGSGSSSRALAATNGHEAAGAVQGGEFLTFRLGTEEYCVDILLVQEIRSFEQPTRIANAPSYIKGVMNLRGVIVPIIDLRMKLGCENVLYNHMTGVIVLNVRNRVVGAVVDSVSDVLALSSESIQPAPKLNASVDTRFIKGICSVSVADLERMLIVVDIDGLVGVEEMGLAEAACA
jgi:purine-binding chemotaxis protein CheW